MSEKKLKMESYKNDSVSTSTEQRWSQNNSLLYLFVDYVLPKECHNYSSIDIQECVEWLQLDNKTKGNEFQIEVKTKLNPILTMLLEAKNNVNFTNRLEESVLRVFLSKYVNNSTNPCKDQKMIESLLKKGASVDVIDSIGYTPIQYAATICRPDLVQLMLDYSDDLNIRNSLGHTVLHLLIYNYEQHPSELHLEAIRNSLIKGAFINAKNKKGLTPVHLALQNGLVKILLIFVEYGINLNDYIGNDSNLLLHLCKNIANWTRSAEELKALDLLIDLKKNVKSRSRKFYLTPLHFISQVDRPDVIEIFLKAGADIDATSVDGITPLHLAALQGSLSVLKYLIIFGANVNAKEEMVGFDLMHMAVLSGDKEKFNFLVENGFDVNVKSKHGLTPFHLAVIMADNKMLKCLIDKSVNFREGMKRMGMIRLNSMDIDCTDQKSLIGADENVGEMSLISQYAKSLNLSREYVDELMKLLLDAGGNVNSRDSCLKTPLHYATMQKNGNISTLLSLGAYVDAKDREMKLPLQNVLNSGNSWGLIELLRFGVNVNDIADCQVHELNVEIVNKMYEYLTKLDVANLVIPDGYKGRLSRRITHKDVNSLRSKFMEEVIKLKQYYLTDSKISLYDFLHMNSRKRLMYVETVLSFNLYLELPFYMEIVEASCREAMHRSSLMKQAGSALCQLTGMNLPEICTDKIFQFLANADLIVVIDSFVEYDVS